MRTEVTTWTVDTEDSPLLGCLAAAAAAPSVHNTQPWLFRLRNDGVDLLLDRRRRLAVIDPAGRAALVSVGAALLNLRVAMLAYGRTPVVRLSPVPDQPDLVARVTVGPPVRVTQTARLLARAIPRRHTNRQPFADIAVPAEVRAELRAAAAAEGATLTLLEPAARGEVLSVVRTAEQRWHHDPRYWAELDDWTRPVPGRRDGVPLAAFGPWSVRDALPLRDFGLVRPTQRRWAVPFERSPLLAVLSTLGDGRRQRLRAGQALQRTLLTATVRGVSTSLLNQPLEIPELRHLVLAGTFRSPHAIIRLGYGRPSAPSPRRRLSDLLVIGDHTDLPATAFPSGTGGFPSGASAYLGGSSQDWVE